ncbi:unnamed protein product [Ilex paraguariensis]|uniref:Uncharacterized protein n=1 Tax=Ilex paraguariensis TaxID=185542 RepID=A0ABC8RVN2_9AQUA
MSDLNFDIFNTNSKSTRHEMTQSDTFDTLSCDRLLVLTSSRGIVYVASSNKMVSSKKNAFIVQVWEGHFLYSIYIDFFVCVCREGVIAALSYLLFLYFLFFGFPSFR